MLVVALSLIAVVSPVVALRWPAGLLLSRWKWPALIWATLVLQIAVVEVELPRGFAPVLHVLTYGAALAFLWLNRRVPGALMVGAGAALNGITITLNGGTLPASRGAAEAAGFDPDLAFANSAVLENPVLPWLGDVFAWPAPLPLANTFSAGDVLIVLGVWVAAWSGTRRIGKTSGPSKETPTEAKPTKAEPTAAHPTEAQRD